MARAKIFVDVIDGDVEAIAQQARGEMAAEIAQADIAVAHHATGWLVISRCSLSPV